jgi:phosphoglycerate dehydrogenase-like enzyme
VILTPHVASATAQCHLRQGQITVDEVERFVRGEPLRYEVTPQMLAIMA